MSKEMDLIKGLKVSDVFDLTKVSFPSSYTDDQVRVAGRAIANYDRMADEIAELRGVLAQVLDGLEDAEATLEQYPFNRSLVSEIDLIKESLNK